MDITRDHSLRFRLGIAFLCFFLVASSIVLLCDTRSHGRIFQKVKLNHRISSSSKSWNNLKSLKHFLDTKNTDSPLFSFSNFDDSYGIPSPLLVSLPPSSSQAPQPSSSSSSSPYPPTLTPPNLPKYSPINHYPPPPPKITQNPSPPQSPPSKHGPSPPMAYSPPIPYPPPRSVATGSTPPPPPSPPPHNKRPRSIGHWCVAKPTVPDSIIKQAMDYACGSGADCKGIQPNGQCYEPNTMLAHASYAFNSYWQNRKAAGGTCDFGGTAMLVTVDPNTRSHGRIFQKVKLNHRISSSSKSWNNLKSLKHFLDTKNTDSPLFSFSNFDDSYGIPSPLLVSLPPSSSQAPQPSSSSSSSPYPPTLTPPNLPKYSPINHYPPPPPKNTQTPSPTQSPPSKHGPSPPMAYSPPFLYPPPRSVPTGSTPPPPPPPPHNKRPRSIGHWCVAKPTVPDSIIKQAMDYACGSGADCKGIQPNGQCYEPNTMLAHASYAFNSYWQNRKAAGGTCDFGGTAMLVTVDPSFGKCHFMMN